MADPEMHTPTSLHERLLSETMDTADMGELQGLGSNASSFYDRSRTMKTFGPLTAGGVRQSIFVLVQTALGGGVLTIAYMLRISGPFMGVFLLLAGAIVAFVSMDVLMKSAVHLHRYTFGALLSYAFGPKSGIFLDLMLFLYGNGSLLTYFIFLGDFVPSIYLYVHGGDEGSALYDHNSPEYLQLRSRCMIGGFLLVFPVASFPKDLSGFRYLSPIMLIAILYTESLVVYTCCMLLGPSPDGWWQHFGEVGIHFPSAGQVASDFSWSSFAGNFGNICKSFSISVFAYCCHLNVVPVAKEIVNPEDRRIEKICWRVAALQLVIYMILAVAGYLSFGAGTPQNLLQAFSASSFWAFISRCLMALTVLVALATNTNPTVRALLCLLEVRFESLRDHDYGLSPADLQASPQRRPESVSRALKSEEPRQRQLWRYAFSVACLAGDMVIGIYVRDVATVVGLLGASMGNVMMMVIPVLLLYLLRDKLYTEKWKTVTIAVILLLGFIFAGASMVIS